MNINLNLATRPYIELRPVYARLRVLAVGLAVLALPMLLVVHTEETKARLAEARVNQLESNIALLRRQQTAAQALALQGPNANVLNASAFLNDLFRRKAFSWTATMIDLESVLPAGVQVQAIDPVVSPDGHVVIRMRVTGGRDRAVDVIHNLEHSRHFVAPRLVTEALANQNGGGNARQVSVSTAPGALPAGANDVNFDILADYRPLPNSHSAAGKTSAAAAATASPEAQLTNPDPAGASRTLRSRRHPAATRSLPGTPVGGR
ncbi:fimbrial assembly protein [Acidipila sp. EB88]|uniref:fimbrial assembly protein n=1 Tax=Acidipila sp. EB88 TaxID=2305226 RepID=UPI000F5EBCDA|nr:fimbrial assembly protein [Acidipila sp. EB88]RRA48976.1 fimbrial assembly protein [Acidipila sp. EB88]